MKYCEKAKIILKDFVRFCYHKIPWSLRHSQRYKREYYKIHDLICESQYWSRDKVEEYQNKKLQETLVYAYNNVPYYHDLFEKEGIELTSITDKEQFKRIPYLTKEIIKEHWNELISTEYCSQKIMIHETGGSSGKPVKFCFEKDIDQAKEDAFVDMVYSRIGCNKQKSRIVWFGDTTFIREATAVDKNIICKKSPGMSIWYFSSVPIESKADKYVEEIKGIKPEYIITYPSCLYRLLNRVADENNMDNPFKGLKGIIFSSEMLYPYQIELFKRIFKDVQMLSVYGHTEHACMMSTCEKSMRFHIQHEYGFSEFIPSYDDKMELIATTFDNKVMPLIRYKTQDLFVLSDIGCECGRTYHMVDTIEGRTCDKLYLKNGLIVTDIFCDFTTISGSWMSSVAQYQIVQNEIGKCKFLLMPKAEKKISDEELQLMKKEMENYFFNEMEVTIEIVDSIPKTGRGKQKLIVSTLNEK